MLISEAITYQKAIEYLTEHTNSTEAELRQLLSQMSVKVQGSTSTLLYSGTLDTVSEDGIKSWQVAEKLGTNSSGKVATIGQTDAGLLLGNQVYFRNSLISAVGPEQADIIINGTTNSSGVRITPGLWDETSAKFVNNISGDLKTLVPTSEFDSVFTQTEIRAILDNSNIASVDGVSKSVYNQIYENAITAGKWESEALLDVQKSIKAESYAHSVFLDVAVDSGGNITHIKANADFWDSVTDVVYSDIPEGTSGRVSVGDWLEDMHVSSHADVIQGTKSLLSVLGHAAVGVDIFLNILSLKEVLSDATEQWDAGKKTEAAETVSEWAAGTTAAYFAGTEAASYVLGKAFVERLVLSSGPGKVIGAVLVGGSALLSAVLGEVAAKEVVDKLFDIGKSIGLLAEDLVSNGLLHMFGADTAQLNDLPTWYENTYLWYGLTGLSWWDPLVVDLNGNGVRADLKLNQTVYFDIDNDGIGESMNWVGASDGFLVRDVNGNGKIDNGAELFGDATTNGFIALKAFDLNNDGVVDANDAIFGDLKIWRDLNQNGISEAEELYTLQEYGITGIDVVNYITTGLQTGAAFTESGTIQVANVNFSISQVNTHYVQDYDLDLRALFLPTMHGYADLVDFHVALSQDNDETDPASLMALTLSLVSRNMTDTFANWAIVKDTVIDILYRWAGVDQVDPASRGQYVDARELAFVEAYMGTMFTDGHLIDDQNNPGLVQAQALHEFFTNVLVPRLMGDIFSQTALTKFYTNNFSYDIVNDDVLKDGTGHLTLSHDVVDSLSIYASSLPDTAARESFWNGVADFMNAMRTASSTGSTATFGMTSADEAYLDIAVHSSDASLVWSQENHAPVNGLTSVEYRYYNPLGDTIEGTSSNDNLSGTVNEDAIVGLAGADTIHGGELADVIYGHNKDGSGDDGAADILYGDEGDDYLNGGNGNDILYGGHGSDHLIGGAGNDILSGGNDIQGSRSQNLMEGGLGNDYYKLDISGNGSGTTEAYIIDAGGVDTVEIPIAIAGSSLSFVRIGDSSLQVAATSSGGAASSSVVLVDQLADVGLDAGIEYIKFIQNNSTLDLRAYLSTYTAKIVTQGSDANDVIHGIKVGSPDDTIYANKGNDLIYGDEGDDYLDSGAGNDEMHGGVGNDSLKGDYVGFNTLFGDEGNDHLSTTHGEAHGGSGADTISVGDAVAYGEDGDDIITAGYEYVGGTVFGGSGNDTINGGYGSDFLYGGAGDDTIYGGSDGLDTVGYIDSSNGVIVNLSLGYADALNMGHDIFTSIENLSGSNFDDTLTGSSVANVLWGADGNDQLDGASGSDILYGDAGNDTLLGGVGKDNLYGGEGNDLLDGGRDNDNFFGGNGVDSIVYAALSSGFIIYRDNVDYLTIINTGNTTSAGYATDKIYNDVESITFSDLVLDLKDGSLDAIGSEWGYAVTNGTSADETLSGSAGRDIIHGGSGSDAIRGYDRNDQLYGDAGSDTIYGGNGDDIVYGGTESDTLYGEAGNDTIYSEAGGGNSYGGDGNDIIYGGSGADTLWGDAGDDILNGDAGNDGIHGGDGVDTAVYNTNSTNFIIYREMSGYLSIKDTGNSGMGTDKFYNDIERVLFNDITLDLTTMTFNLGEVGWGTALPIYGTSVADSIIGNQVDDIIYGYDGNDYIEGGIGNDYIYGGAGVDTLNAGAGDDYIDGGIGNDTLNGENGNDIIYGGDGADTIRGDAGNDTIYSEAGGGNSYGGDGSDIIYGGSGADTLWGDAGDDILNGDVGNDNLHGGDGVDTAVYSTNSTNFIIYREVSGSLSIKDTGSSGLGTDKFYNDIEKVQFNDVTLDLTTMTFNLGEVGWGTPATLYGTTAGETISGYQANSIIYANAGNDTVNGGVGNDTIYGEAGADTLNGGNGNDYLDGGAGNDVLVGGAGTDTASYKEATASITVSLAIITSQSTVGAGTDTLTQIENLIGSAYNDMLTGDANANTIEGGNGNDTLNGGAGIDTVSYASVSSAVTVDIGNSSAQNTGGAGVDTLTNFENMIGSAYNDTLTGDGLSNSISGGLGDDMISGGLGNDILNGGAGIDTVSYASSLNGVTVNLAITGAQDTSGAGTDTLTDIENIIGSDVDDYLYGNALDNILIGNGENDELGGGAGNDRLEGGVGSDTYIYNAGDGIDTILDEGEDYDLLYVGGSFSINDVSSITSDAEGTMTISLGGGTDTIRILNQASAGYGVEWIAFADGYSLDLKNAGSWLWGSDGSDDVLSGSSSSDTIIGRAGNDDLSGNMGFDNIYGGIGDDTLYGGGDTDYLFGEDGNDILMGDTGDDLLKGGDGSDQLFGQDGRDMLYGEAGADILNGGDGQDYVSGGSDDDTLYGETGDDYLFGDDGADQLFGGFANDTLYGGIGNDILSGESDNDTLYGEGGNDTLKGDSGADNLYGGEGNDVLLGGYGWDTLTGGNGLDAFVFKETDAIDHVKDFNTSQGDYIELGSLLLGYDPVTSAIADFVSSRQSGGNTIISVDRDGAGSQYASLDIISLDAVTGGNIQTMLDNEQLKITV